MLPRLVAHARPRSSSQLAAAAAAAAPSTTGPALGASISCASPRSLTSHAPSSSSRATRSHRPSTSSPRLSITLAPSRRFSTTPPCLTSGPAPSQPPHPLPNYPRRAMLYVPGSSEKMVKKTLTPPSPSSSSGAPRATAKSNGNGSAKVNGNGAAASEAPSGTTKGEADAKEGTKVAGERRPSEPLQRPDCYIYDLEDSVASHRKGAARETVRLGLEAAPRPGPELAVRINPPSSARDLASDDLDVILPCRSLETIVVPKVEHEDDVRFIIEKAKHLRLEATAPLSLILSVESAASLLRMPRIIETIREEAVAGHHAAAEGDPEMPIAVIAGLLFASEDFCASTSIVRTRARTALYVPRAQMVLLARSYGLSAIDMVCVDYTDQEYLDEECREGKEMGFDGKQAIHPSQVAGIQRVYSPSKEELDRAQRIKAAYEASVADHKGAVGMMEGESMVMIDAPMLKQAENLLEKARASGLLREEGRTVKGKAGAPGEDKGR